MSVTVLTDSSACLPESVLSHLKVRVAQLHIVDSSDVTTTAGVAPAEFSRAFEDALNEPGCDGVVAIVLAGSLSGTHSAAVVASRQYEDHVEVVDSRSAGMGLGLTVIAAAQAALDGGDIGEVVRVAEDVLRQVVVYIYVPTLDPLRQGGRISGTSAAVASALSVKPIIRLEHGKLEVVSKLRTSTRAKKKLLSILADTLAKRYESTGFSVAIQSDAATESGSHPSVDSNGAYWVAITDVSVEDMDPRKIREVQEHNRSTEIFNAISELFHSYSDGKPPLVLSIDPVLQAHLGSGATAIALAGGDIVTDQVRALFDAGRHQS